MADQTYRPSSVWINIWRQPRVAIEDYLKSTSESDRSIILPAGIWVLAIASGIVFRQDSLGSAPVVIAQLAFASIIALLGVWSYSKVLHWSGKKLRGNATHRAVFSALIWSRIPTIVAATIAVPVIIMSGMYVIVAPGHRDTSAPVLVAAVIVIGVNCLATVLTEVTCCRCLSQVHGVGWKRTLCSQVMADAIVFAVPLAMFVTFLLVAS